MICKDALHVSSYCKHIPITPDRLLPMFETMPWCRQSVSSSLMPWEPKGSRPPIRLPTLPIKLPIRLPIRGLLEGRV